MLNNVGNTKILKNIVLIPDSPHENVDAKSRRNKIPKTLSSLGFPYAKGIFPTIPAAGGLSDKLVSRENLSTSASIC